MKIEKISILFGRVLAVSGVNKKILLILFRTWKELKESRMLLLDRDFKNVDCFMAKKS